MTGPGHPGSRSIARRPGRGARGSREGTPHQILLCPWPGQPAAGRFGSRPDTDLPRRIQPG
jgi:hypothetical protein